MDSNKPFSSRIMKKGLIMGIILTVWWVVFNRVSLVYRPSDLTVLVTQYASTTIAAVLLILILLRNKTDSWYWSIPVALGVFVILQLPINAIPISSRFVWGTLAYPQHYINKVTTNYSMIGMILWASFLGILVIEELRIESSALPKPDSCLTRALILSGKGILMGAALILSDKLGSLLMPDSYLDAGFWAIWLPELITFLCTSLLWAVFLSWKGLRGSYWSVIIAAAAYLLYLTYPKIDQPYMSHIIRQLPMVLRRDLLTYLQMIVLTVRKALFGGILFLLPYRCFRNKERRERFYGWVHVYTGFDAAGKAGPEDQSTMLIRILQKGIMAGIVYCLFWSVFVVFSLSHNDSVFFGKHILYKVLVYFPSFPYLELTNFWLPALTAAGVAMIFLRKGSKGWGWSLCIALILRTGFDLLLYLFYYPTILNGHKLIDIKYYLFAHVLYALEALVYIGITMGIAAVLIRCSRKGH